MSGPLPPPPPPPPGASEEAAAAALDAYLLSPKFHGRVRAATVALLALTLGACVTADWESFYGGGGKRTVFSDVRPALRSALDRLYGGGGGDGGAPQQQQQQAQQQQPVQQRR